MKSVLNEALGLPLAVIKSQKIDAFNNLIVSVRPRKTQMRRCPYCGRKSQTYDTRGITRRWRSLDVGTTRVYLEYEIVRIECPMHGVHTESVPWAHHKSRFTYEFEQQVAWLCTNANRSCVSELMRIDWKTVGSILRREYNRLDSAFPSRFSNLLHIGIDETSYKKGHKYMTVVLNHDTGRVVWCAKGYGKEVLETFFSLLTQQQRNNIKVVSSDGARWIESVISKRCPNAQMALDPFHVVSWMSNVLDELRRKTWRSARTTLKQKQQHELPRRRGRPKKGEVIVGSKESKTIETYKGTKFCLLKNPENLTNNQTLALERLFREDKTLYRAYLLKERLRDVFKAKDVASAKELLNSWLKSASHSWVAEIKELSKKIRRHKERIINSIALGISNARVEAINNKIKLTIRMSYGFRNMDNLIAFIMLRCSNLPIVLPGRST